MKRMMLAILCAVSMSACARFTTKQTDISYDDQGKAARTITTKAAAWTIFEAKSELASFKAMQTDKSQSASVGTLNQQATGTNTVAALEAVLEIVKAVR